MDFLNEYFTLMVDEVFQERGVLDKFIGDALMAVFGVPYAQDDDAVRAVRASLGMCRALDAFNLRRVRSGMAPIRIGIGINTDDVISGNMGSHKRMDYTVIGDGVNLASRIEGLNKIYGTTLLISQSTRQLLGDHFRTRAVDRVVAKGKQRPVEIHEVLGLADHPLSEAQQRFETGYGLYQRGFFDQALAEFEAGADDDGPCRTYIQRCEAFIRSPPADWDGVWFAQSK